MACLSGSYMLCMLVMGVVVRRVLTLYKLYAPPSSVIGVFHKLSMSVSYVSNGSNDV